MGLGEYDEILPPALPFPQIGLKYDSLKGHFL